jgi:hypothetical protein
MHTYHVTYTIVMDYQSNVACQQSVPGVLASVHALLMADTCVSGMHQVYSAPDGSLVMHICCTVLRRCTEKTLATLRQTGKAIDSTYRLQGRSQCCPPVSQGVACHDGCGVFFNDVIVTVLEHPVLTHHIGDWQHSCLLVTSSPCAMQ